MGLKELFWAYDTLGPGVGCGQFCPHQVSGPDSACMGGWADGLMGLSRKLCSINNVLWPIDRVSRSGSFSSYHLSATLQSFGSQI